MKFWTKPELFQLDKERNPLFVAGVPADQFSATGQLWGNPLYDGKNIKNKAILGGFTELKKASRFMMYSASTISKVSPIIGK